MSSQTDASSQTAPSAENIYRTIDFYLYALLEQERKMFDKTLYSLSLITNPIPLWYSYASAFASTTMSMRIPIWFVCSIWTVWQPDLYLQDMGRIVAAPDTQGASLALLSALDLPEGVTPAKHITGTAKHLRELVVGWNKDRAAALGKFSLESAWESIETALAQFYLDKLRKTVTGDYLHRAWQSVDALSAGMPYEMNQDDIKHYILGSPIKPSKK